MIHQYETEYIFLFKNLRMYNIFLPHSLSPLIILSLSISSPSFFLFLSPPLFLSPSLYFCLSLLLSFLFLYLFISLSPSVSLSLSLIVSILLFIYFSLSFFSSISLDLSFKLFIIYRINIVWSRSLQVKKTKKTVSKWEHHTVICGQIWRMMQRHFLAKSP